jgi:hypothetical protein
MQASFRLASAVLAAALGIGAGAVPFEPSALEHTLVTGERFVYESTITGQTTTVMRVELTVQSASPSGAMTVRQRNYIQDTLAWEATIQTDAAQHAWRYTAGESRGAAIVPIWDPGRYGIVPKRLARRWTTTRADGVDRGTERVTVDGDAITIERTTTQSKSGRDDAVTVQRHGAMVWSHGILQLYDTTVDEITVGGRPLSGVGERRTERLLEHTTPAAAGG